MSISFYQLNISNLNNEINHMRLLALNPNNLLIGLEVTMKELSKHLTFNIDPQHRLTGVDSFRRITCLEKVKETLPIFKELVNKNLHIFILKSDLDSISSAALLDIYFNDHLMLTSEMNDRISAIADYDRHGRISGRWRREVPIPSGLFMLVSGWQNSIEKKIEYVKSWIISGNFDQMGHYNKLASDIVHKSVCRSRVEIIIPDKLVFIKSTTRGACGLGYRLAPIVIAFNPSYRFGFGEKRIYGKKWIISQYNESYIDLIQLLHQIKKNEPNWGGSSTIIGSPQDRPSKLTKDFIIELTKSIIIS